MQLAVGIRLAVIGVLVLTPSSRSGVRAQESPDSGAFITRLGTDTIAMESWVRTGTHMEVHALLRTPSTRARFYVIELNDQGGLSHYEAGRWDGPFRDGPAQWRWIAESDGKNMAFQLQDGDQRENGVFDVQPGILPFIDFVQWPFELMLSRFSASGVEVMTQPLVSGTRVFEVELARTGPGRGRVTHPTLGVMELSLDDRGRMVRLDGSITRGLTVTREAWLDIDGLARRFAARDEEQGAMGPLSGRGEAVGTIQGATIRIDYGRPSKRGRELFGGLVPYGQIWRTGANLATHLETDQDLVLAGELTVPAGAYTLYTIPEPDGGVLIVSTGTGQGGADYPEGQDLGRVPLEATTLESPVEVFTIEVGATEVGGRIQLIWDRTVLSVPFTVAGSGP
jgi:hypothetical protein